MKKSLIIFSIAITMYSVPANADILIYDSLFGGSRDVQNVLFSDTNNNDVGLSVDGFLNQTLEIVNFTGNDNLSTPSSGQARINAVDGSFSSILIKMSTYSALKKPFAGSYRYQSTEGRQRNKPCHILTKANKTIKEHPLPQLLEDDTDIVPCSAEQGIYFVAQHAQQGVPPQLAVRLHVPDHWFDGTSSF